MAEDTKTNSEKLYRASADGDLESVTTLLKAGADPNYTPSDYGLWTPLHAACANNRPYVVEELIKHKANIQALERQKYTPLHFACQYGYMECIKAFESKMETLFECDLEISPLAAAISKQQLIVIKFLLNKYQGSFETKEYWDDILKLSCSEGDIEFVMSLIYKFKFIPEDSKENIFGLCCEKGELTLAKDIVKKYKCSPKADDLVSACENGHDKMVEYLLNELKCDPNSWSSYGHVPLTKAKEKKIIQLLLQHGANAKDAYDQHRRSLGLFRSKNPLQNPVKMFVIGDGGEGKSTLIEAMQHEKVKKNNEVTGVSEQTAGIVQKIFESDVYGSVQFFDFAGQEAYRSSHTAVIKSSVVACPPVFLLLVGLHKDDQHTSLSLKHWLGIIVNHCMKMDSKAPLIVVGSHQDQVSSQKIEDKKKIIKRIVEKYLVFNFIGFVAMDCRLPKSTGMKELRMDVGRACSSLRSKLSVSLNSHMLLIYLSDKLKDSTDITLKDLQLHIKSSTEHIILSKKEKEILSFIPTEIPPLVEICKQLSDKGHILFIENTNSPEQSYVIIDQMSLTAEVNGSIFAPAHFKEHCQVATSTGVVPKSKLIEHFPGHNINMLVGFLSCRELAVPIEDGEVLNSIKEQFSAIGQHKEDETYLFCPGLIRLDAPKSLDHMQHFEYRFGWVISCSKEDQFFNLHLFQVLLLRLALSNKLAVQIDDSIPSLKKVCSVWKTGIFWLTNNDIPVLVQLAENYKSIKLLLQANSVTPEFTQLRNELINKITKAVKELCPAVLTHESLIDQSSSKCPREPFDHQIFVSNLAKSIVKCEPRVVYIHDNVPKSIEVCKLVPYEVYTNLGENVLQALFGEEQQYDKLACDEFLYEISLKWEKGEVLNHVAFAFDMPTPVVNSHDFYFAFKKWRDEYDATYKSIRLILDKRSVFAGKNILELAGLSSMIFMIDHNLQLPDNNAASTEETACSSQSHSNTIFTPDLNVAVQDSVDEDLLDSPPPNYSALSSPIDKPPPSTSKLPQAQQASTAEVLQQISTSISEIPQPKQVSTPIAEVSLAQQVSTFSPEVPQSPVSPNEGSSITSVIKVHLPPNTLPGLQSPVSHQADLTSPPPINVNVHINQTFQLTSPSANENQHAMPDGDRLTQSLPADQLRMGRNKPPPRQQSLPSSSSTQENRRRLFSSCKKIQLDIAKVEKILNDVRPEWNALGLQLGIDKSTLEIIEKDFKDTDKCFQSMLNEFFCRLTPTPTIKILVEALRSPPVHRIKIANYLSQYEESQIKSHFKSSKSSLH